MKEMEMFSSVCSMNKETRIRMLFLHIRFAWILVSEDVPGHAAKVLWQGWWLMPVVYLQVAFENGCLSFHRAHSRC